MQVTHEQEYTITESTTTSLDTSFAQSVEVSYGAGLNVGVFNANYNVTIGAHFGQSIHKGETVKNTSKTHMLSTQLSLQAKRSMELLLYSKHLWMCPGKPRFVYTLLAKLASRRGLS